MRISRCGFVRPAALLLVVIGSTVVTAVAQIQPFLGNLMPKEAVNQSTAGGALQQRIAIPTAPMLPVTYSLLAGSQLINDCPVCARPSMPVPMTGTFQLMVLESNSLFTRYQVTNVSFTASSAAGANYRVTGDGTYQQGGEVAIQQSMALSAPIDNGGESTLALMESATEIVSMPWPQIQIGLEQTNGTSFHIYHLDIVAAPALQFTSINPTPQKGGLGLEWTGNAGPVQLEGATNATGPYFPVASNLVGGTFQVSGSLTNQAQWYLRLLQK